MLSGTLHILESLCFSWLKSLHASDNSRLDLLISLFSSYSVEKLMVVLKILLPILLTLDNVNSIVVGSVGILSCGAVPTLRFQLRVSPWRLVVKSLGQYRILNKFLLLQILLFFVELILTCSRWNSIVRKWYLLDTMDSLLFVGIVESGSFIESSLQWFDDGDLPVTIAPII